MNTTIAIVTILIGTFDVTSYRSVSSQTDDTPYHTSIGQRTHPHGIAVSQDLLKSGHVRYGDLIYVEDVGFKFVNDTMHIRHKEHIDVWVSSYKEEQEFHRKFKGRKLKVWIVKHEGKSQLRFRKDVRR